MGLINVGTFLTSYGLGVLISIWKFRPDKNDWSKKTWSLFLSILTEAVCAGFILGVTIYHAKNEHTETEERSPLEDAILAFAILAMIVLAFLHGIISTHFLTWRPPPETITNDR